MKSVKKIFVIDDDRFILNLCRTVLEAEGFEVSVFERAGDCLKHFADSSGDLIVFDFLMPDMDGEQFIARIAEMTSGSPPPLILYSAASGDLVTKIKQNPHLTGMISKGTPVMEIPRAMEKILAGA